MNIINRAGLFALGLTFSALPAWAQGEQDTIAQLRQQMQAMQRRLDALEGRAAATAPAGIAASARRAREAERSAEAAQASAERSRLALEQARVALPQATAAIPPATGPGALVTQGTLPNSFRIPGTGTSVRIYGQIIATGSRDFSARNRSDVVTVQAVALGATVATRQGGDFRFDARRSRFGFETSTPTSWGDLRTLVEMDFAGSQSTASLIAQSGTSGYIPRLRLAFAELAGFSVGQNWSLFYDENYGQRFDYSSPNGISNVRSAQFRYAYRFSNGVSLAASVENPYTDGTFSSGVRYNDSDAFVAPFPTGTGTLTTTNKVPDLLARVRWDSDTWGNFSLTGVLRPNMSINNRGDANPALRYERSVNGGGVQLATSWRVLERDRIYARVVYGVGIGRYLDGTSNGQGFVSNALNAGVTPSQVRLNTVPLLSLVGGFTHFWTPAIRTNALAAWTRQTFPSYITGFANAGRSALNRDIVSTNVNLIWSPVPQVDVGFEYNYASRTLELAQTDGVRSGVAHRLQMTGLVRF